MKGRMGAGGRKDKAEGVEEKDELEDEEEIED